MKTLATIVVEINWENKYEETGIPDMEEAIKDHIQSIEDETFGYEWDTEDGVAYVEGDLKIIDIKSVELIEPSIGPLPFCEHCGKNHEEFGCEFNDGGTSWCLSCYLADKPNSEYLFKYYRKLEKEAHIKYLENKIKELKV